MVTSLRRGSAPWRFTWVILYTVLATALLISLLQPAYNVRAQSYHFHLDQQIVNYYLNPDGTTDLEYTFVFDNLPDGLPIDFVDVGLPASNYHLAGVTAELEGKIITNIDPSGYQGTGWGIALGLGEYAIPAGKTGTVKVYIPGLEVFYYPDDQDSTYASLGFSPTYFGAEFLDGFTDMTVAIHLPPDVDPEEARWHAAPSGFNDPPETGLDEQGRVTYTWHRPDAPAYYQLDFGISIPVQYIPARSIYHPPPAPTPIPFENSVGDDQTSLIGLLVILAILCYPVYKLFESMIARQGRRSYLPPSISIEGHGIKRGLTAVEAAILLDQPMDRILTMILFGLLKKGAVRVLRRDPLDIIPSIPISPDLQLYEREFLDAFQIEDNWLRDQRLKGAISALVRNVSAKLKGFSRRETIAYYQDIVRRAWAQVEAADTPEIKMSRFDDGLEWTMLDRKFEERARQAFGSEPISPPTWWLRFDPTFLERGRTMQSITSAQVSPPIPTAPSRLETAAATNTPPGSSRSSMSLPNLPGATMAASIVRGVQDFSAHTVGDLTKFTSSVIERTQPRVYGPDEGERFTKRSSWSWLSNGGSSSSSSRRSSSSSSYRSSSKPSCACACACACAGCACACAGGGR